MSCFIDTSAFIAISDPNDLNHSPATQLWDRLLLSRRQLLSTNYVIVETVALMHTRRGIPVVQRFTSDLVPVLTVAWIDKNVHDAAMSAVLAGGRRGPSMVDCVSFEIMRRRGITEALAFDRHFADLGYDLPS